MCLVVFIFILMDDELKGKKENSTDFSFVLSRFMATAGGYQFCKAHTHTLAAVMWVWRAALVGLNKDTQEHCPQIRFKKIVMHEEH